MADAQAPAAPYGGYPVASPVPYQPTLAGYPGSSSPPPTVIYDPPLQGPVMMQSAPPAFYAYPNQAAGPYAPGGPQAYPATPAAPAILPEGAVIDPNTGQVWQTYPGAGGVVPATTPGFPPQEPIYPSTPEPGQPESLIPPGSRDGVFQKIKLTGTYLPQLESDSLGFADLRTDVVFGLPFFQRETPLVITPGYEVHFLDRPDGVELPPRLHDAEVEFHHFRRIGSNWIGDLSVTLGVYADDHSFDSADAFRVTGRGLAVYESSREWRWVMGLAYLNGAGWDVIPVFGVVHKPNDDVEYQFVFPSPKISWRLPNSPVPGLDERWFYVAAEFGGGLWAVERGGVGDRLISRDYRIIAGLERKIVGGLSRRIEVGYVFGRELEFDSLPGEISLDDTLLLRVGLVY